MNGNRNRRSYFFQGVAQPPTVAQSQVKCTLLVLIFLFDASVTWNRCRVCCYWRWLDHQPSLVIGMWREQYLNPEQKKPQVLNIVVTRRMLVFCLTFWHVLFPMWRSPFATFVHCQKQAASRLQYLRLLEVATWRNEIWDMSFSWERCQKRGNLGC